MKMKFQEFAKDFGLIVVGYAGHDRSIMDILTYLLQHEDYFKNGIYWCIRKDDKNISGELKKKFEIDPEKCIKCGKCYDTCRFGAIAKE